jgi:hypothetical protein
MKPYIKEIFYAISFIAFLFIGYCLYYHSYEGFEDSKPSFSPQVASYELLKNVMGPIRRLSSIVLNPTNWKDRISMATMSPTELARMHLQSLQKVE